ncbi:MAG: hypothetical protein WBE68_00870, partial [Candidatus Nitrosopolaris sp.]
RSGSIIILYLFSIISTCYYTPRLECQPCQEPKMSTMYGSSTLNTPDIPVPNPPCTVNALWNVPLNKAYEQSYKYCIPFWKGTVDGQKYTAKIIDTCSRF